MSFSLIEGVFQASISNTQVFYLQACCLYHLSRVQNNFEFEVFFLPETNRNWAMAMVYFLE